MARSWHPLCWSSELRGARPLRRVMRGVPLVLFRDASGRACALADRCAHRGFPLSRGRVEAGRIRCAYHGWTFEASGACAAVPALAGAESRGHAERSVPAVPVREADGLLWAWGGRGPADGEPPRVETRAGEGSLSLRWSFELEGALPDVAENVLDVPHTAFLHGGVFRRPGRGLVVEARVRRRADRIEAEYVGEPAPAGLLGRLLAPGGGVVSHVDRFVVPCVTQVEYGLGRMRLLATTFLCAGGERRTHALHVLSLAPRALAVAALPLLGPAAWWVLRQDANALRLQSRNLAAFPDLRPASTEADVLGPHVEQMLRRVHDGVPPLPDADWTARLAP